MEEIFILDHIEDFKLSGDEIKNNYEERMALAHLAEGLFWIYREVKKLENQAREESKSEHFGLNLVGGDVLNNKSAGLLSCTFQWYAISACNYAQLVGWMATHDTKSAKNYVKKVMPKLNYYRNKVAAHFAITNRYQEDNDADVQASIMTQIIFTQGRLCAATLSPVLQTHEREIIEANRKLPWSLTWIHNLLSKRYWPNGEPNSSQAIRVPGNGEIHIKANWANLFENSA